MRKLCLILALLAVAAVPPLPPQRHKSAAVHQGAGAAKLISKLAPARPKIVSAGKRLAWTYTPNTDNPASNIVFLVRSSPMVLTRRHDYSLVAITTSNSWPFTVDVTKPSAFFVVSASNVVNHTESP